MTDALLRMMRLDAGGAVQSGRCTFVHWVHFKGSGPDWRQIRESPAPGPANLREAIGMFCHNSANVHTYARTGDMLGIHSPDWRPKIKSSLGISPDTGDRKINSQARFRQYGDRLKTLFRALVASHRVPVWGFQRGRDTAVLCTQSQKLIP
jgi:hypothetical protein